MQQQLKTAILLLALITLAYWFGFSVGEHSAMLYASRKNAQRILSELKDALPKTGDAKE